AIEEIPCGSAAKLVFRVRAPACAACGDAPAGLIKATAAIKSADANPANNQDSAEIQVSCALAAGDLAISKVDDTPNPPGPDGRFYTITVKNLGCADIAATVTDIFPAGLTDVLWCRDEDEQSPCTPDKPGDLHDTFPLPAGKSATYHVRAV